MKKAPLKNGAGKEYIDALNTLYSTPPRHNCKNCGILTRWPFCPTCYRWRIHFNATRQAMQAIRGKL